MTKKETSGAGPMIWVPPVMELPDGKHPLRRLGLMDIEALTAIVVKASKFMDRKVVANIDKFTAEEVGSFLIEYLPHAFDEIVAFLATVVGLEPGMPLEVVEKKRKKSKAKEFHDPNEGTIRDPNVFPLGSEIQLITLLTEHPDVVAFFGNSKALIENGVLKNLLGLSSKPSTESNTDTDGPTDTSPEED